MEKPSLAFEIKYESEAEEHLRDLTADQKAQVLDAVGKQLVHQPTVATRNRKKLRPNKLAAWELRVGTLRVYYDVREEPPPAVLILAIGVKRGNRVFIQNREVEW